LRPLRFSIASIAFVFAFLLSFLKGICLLADRAKLTG